MARKTSATKCLFEHRGGNQIAILAMPFFIQMCRRGNLGNAQKKTFFCRSPFLKENDGGNVGYAGKRRLFCEEKGGRRQFEWLHQRHVGKWCELLSSSSLHLTKHSCSKTFIHQELLCESEIENMPLKLPQCTFGFKVLL